MNSFVNLVCIFLSFLVEYLLPFQKKEKNILWESKLMELLILASARMMRRARMIRWKLSSSFVEAEAAAVMTCFQCCSRQAGERMPFGWSWLVSWTYDADCSSGNCRQPDACVSCCGHYYRVFPSTLKKKLNEHLPGS